MAEERGFERIIFHIFSLCFKNPNNSPFLVMKSNFFRLSNYSIFYFVSLYFKKPIPNGYTQQFYKSSSSNRNCSISSENSL